MKTIIFISGGAGVGKESILSHLFTESEKIKEQIKILKPYTNRQPKNRDEQKYIFGNLEIFQNDEIDKVVRVSQIDWTTKYLYDINEIVEFLSSEIQNILIINIDGAGRKQILNKISKYDFNEVFLYIDCLTEETLLSRIYANISQEEKETRLKQLYHERQYIAESDYTIINGSELEDAIHEVESIIKKIIFKHRNVE